MTYQNIVHIGNEIRFVLNTSRQVNLAAQNASLAARRAGDARGFQAVSVELKTFSQQLGEAMGHMADDIQTIAQGVSANYRQRRMHNFQYTAGKKSEPSGALDRALLRSEERLKAIAHDLAGNLQELEMRVEKSLRLCNNGRALARSAMIESTSGGASLGLLRNVARDIERTIEDIHLRLKKVRSFLNNDLEAA